MPPYAVGPPGIGVGSGLGAQSQNAGADLARVREGARAAAAAAAAVRGGAGGAGGPGMRGYGDEYMDMNVEVDPDWAAPSGGETAASDQGAGPLGFAGTVSKGGYAGGGFGYAFR